MRITRPRATAFTQLTGVASAVQMASHVLAAINASVEVTKIADAQLAALGAAKLTGDIPAARMALNVEAAIAGKFTAHNFEIEKDIPQLDLESINANGELWRLESTYAGGANTGTFVIKDEAGNTWLSFTQGGGTPSITFTPGGGAGIDVGAVEPSGMITLWSGAISAIPTGWVLCDGANSTPNLIDRFVIHADADAAGTRNVGDTGGAMTHTLSTAELASHTHTQRGHEAAGAGQVGAEGSDVLLHDLGATTASGSGNAHSILNKYHALAYIMKT